MKITRLQFEGFRNLKDSFIEPCDGVNIIYGNNAQGKTNLLECIWLFTGGHSFRGARHRELVSFERENAKIKMSFYAQQRDQRAEIDISGGKREVTINGVRKSSPSEIIGRFCAIVFSPEHLTFVKSGPGERRRFMDGAICQIKPRYAAVLARYNQTLGQRNALLKEIRFRPELKDTLSIWNERLAYFGAHICTERLAYIKKLRKYAARFHDGISRGTEEFDVKYSSTWGGNEDSTINEIQEKLNDVLTANYKTDFHGGFTGNGPHRDDIDILINGKRAKIYGSQGQQRSAVLSLKLAEAEILKNSIGEKPVILLDDVLSELDPYRQDFLINEINGWQVFITCCEPYATDSLISGKSFNLIEGNVKAPVMKKSNDEGC